MKLYFDKEPINSIAEAIPMYGKKEFQSSTRSTVPLLSWLKHEQPMVNSLLQNLGMPADCNLHLEYKVKPPKGKGNASHTDLMVISGKSSLAIEAKWTEPRYPTIQEWLKKGPNPDNRRDVLNGWLECLRKHSQRPLNDSDFSDIVYQMMHRAASACQAGSRPKLAYLLFKPSSDPDTADIKVIHDDLARLHSLLGNPKDFPFYLVEVHMTPTAAFDEIKVFSKGNQKTAEAVRDALNREPLFNFSKYELHNIN
ncbi:MAG: hypothetical protein EHM45_06400 [Desulfobacteraceae bacterium]|nr:MAG: hypothetical protein EHM45_06400 [Desulfobacteraceae bacterium]